MSGTSMSGTLVPDNILQLALGFWGSKTLLSAVELGLFGELAKAPADLDTLQQRFGLHPRSARDFLDALVALKLLHRDRGIYSNTAETDKFLDPRKPSHVGGVMEMANARLYGFWGSLTEALRTGQPQNEAKHGGDLFTAVYSEPQRLRIFLSAMTGQALPVARALAGAFPWMDVGTVVDIGTAQGCVPV